MSSKTIIHLSMTSMLSRAKGGAGRGGDFDFWPGGFVKIPTPGQHVFGSLPLKKSDFSRYADDDLYSADSTYTLYWH